MSAQDSNSGQTEGRQGESTQADGVFRNTRSAALRQQQTRDAMTQAPSDAENSLDNLGLQLPVATAAEEGEPVIVRGEGYTASLRYVVAGPSRPRVQTQAGGRDDEDYEDDDEDNEIWTVDGVTATRAYFEAEAADREFSDLEGAPAADERMVGGGGLQTRLPPRGWLARMRTDGGMLSLVRAEVMDNTEEERLRRCRLWFLQHPEAFERALEAADGFAALPEEFRPPVIHGISVSQEYIEQLRSRMFVCNHNVSRRPIEEECTICCLKMPGEPIRNLVWCKDGCGHSFHSKCFQRWATTRQNSEGHFSCMYCRVNWNWTMCRCDLKHPGVMNEDGTVTMPTTAADAATTDGNTADVGTTASAEDTTDVGDTTAVEDAAEVEHATNDEYTTAAEDTTDVEDTTDAAESVYSDATDAETVTNMPALEE